VARLLLASLLAAALLAGCAAPLFPAPAEEAPCARLTLSRSSPTLAHGAEVRIEERLENCGAGPLRILDPPCAGLHALRVEGPAVGTLFPEALEAAPSCDAPPVLREVPPGDALVARFAWDGTLRPPCVPEGCPPPEPAPAGRHPVGARIDAAEGDVSWRAETDLLVEAWTDAHEGWSERHVEWMPGAASFSWDRAPGDRLVLKVPEGAAFATDGATFLYAAPLAHDAAQEHACRDAGPPGAGAWVLVAADGCAWAPYPGVRCVGLPGADPCAAAQGRKAP
jgi:hypothetical protein